jgi:hypothetical protein
MKVVGNFHETNMNPQKDMHHNSQGMIEIHLEYIATSHPQMDEINM